MYVQIDLWHEQTERYLTCWVKYRKDLKEGKFITLKGDPTLWLVENVFEDTLLDHPPSTDWKVGGL